MLYSVPVIRESLSLLFSENLYKIKERTLKTLLGYVDALKKVIAFYILFVLFIYIINI